MNVEFSFSGYKVLISLNYILEMYLKANCLKWYVNTLLFTSKPYQVFFRYIHNKNTKILGNVEMSTRVYVFNSVC